MGVLVNPVGWRLNANIYWRNNFYSDIESYQLLLNNQSNQYIVINNILNRINKLFYIRRWIRFIKTNTHMQEKNSLIFITIKIKKTFIRRILSQRRKWFKYRNMKGAKLEYLKKKKKKFLKKKNYFYGLYLIRRRKQLKAEIKLLKQNLSLFKSKSEKENLVLALERLQKRKTRVIRRFLKLKKRMFLRRFITLYKYKWGRKERLINFFSFHCKNKLKPYLKIWWNDWLSNFNKLLYLKRTKGIKTGRYFFRSTYYLKKRKNIRAGKIIKFFTHMKFRPKSRKRRIWRAKLWLRNKKFYQRKKRRGKRKILRAFLRWKKLKFRSSYLLKKKLFRQFKKYNEIINLIKKLNFSYKRLKLKNAISKVAPLVKKKLATKPIHLPYIPWKNKNKYKTNKNFYSRKYRRHKYFGHAWSRINKIKSLWRRNVLKQSFNMLKLTWDNIKNSSSLHSSFFILILLNLKYGRIAADKMLLKLSKKHAVPRLPRNWVDAPAYQLDDLDEPFVPKKFTNKQILGTWNIGLYKKQKSIRKRKLLKLLRMYFVYLPFLLEFKKFLFEALQKLNNLGWVKIYFLHASILNTMNAKYILTHLERFIKKNKRIKKVKKLFYRIVKYLLGLKNKFKLRGFKFCLAGRFLRRNRAVYIWRTYGAVPLSTKLSSIDFAMRTMQMKYSKPILRLWICKK